MGSTLIHWTDEVWNPTSGCSQASIGCTNCYAERVSHRLAGRYGYLMDEPFRVTLHPERLTLPLHWRKPRKIFTDSMGDLFHPNIPDEFLDQVFGVILACATLGNHRHTFQILTKRPERMNAYLTGADPVSMLKRWAYAGDGLVHMDNEDVLFSEWVLGYIDAIWGPDGHALSPIVPESHSENLWPLRNLWLGVSVEDQANADERIPILMTIPAAVRFVSAEPLLGPVDLAKYLSSDCPYSPPPIGCNLLELADITDDTPWHCQGCIRGTDPVPLDWLITGPETGPKARPMDLEWARGLRDQSLTAKVPFFYKGKELLGGVQWREFPSGIRR